MALINIFKKDEPDKPAGEAKKAPKAVASKKEAVLKPAEQKHPGKKAAYNVAAVLKQAHITEKASRLADMNQYVFQIAAGINKSEVRKAVESYYNVDVVGVNIAKVPGKRHRRAKGISTETDIRKAIVKIKTGQKIELLPR